MLTLEDEKLKFAKRKLRIQRCKSVPGSSSNKKLHATDHADGTKQSKVDGIASSRPHKPVASSSTTPSIPKGNPGLGAKLAGLTKEERKRAKAADADRIARRLAKKKVRGALERAGVREVKVRKRERKDRKGGVPGERKGLKDKARKGRVRSDRAAARKNVKK